MSNISFTRSHAAITALLLVSSMLVSPCDSTEPADTTFGGPPGESVTVKAGATDVEPLAVVEDSYPRMNIDVGNQANSGTRAVAFGDIANSRQCEESWQWELKSFEAQPIPSRVSVSSDGRAWILIGTDSGFAGRTGIYFTRISVGFAPI